MRPTDHTEQLAAAWCEILGVAEPTNIYRQHGESLDVAELVTAASAIVGVEIPMSIGFDNANFADFATAVATHARTASAAQPPHPPRTAPVGTSSYQREGLLGIAERVGLDGYRHAAWASRVPQAPGGSPSAMADLATHHALGSVSVVHAEAGSLEEALASPAGDDSTVTVIDIRDAGNEHGIVVVRGNQLVLDEPSVDLVLSMLTSPDAGSLLPPAGFDYRDYVAWQRSGFPPHIERQHLDYWDSELSSVADPGGIPLAPDDHDGWLPTETVGETRGMPVERLSALAAALETTPFNVLLGALAAAVCELAGDDAPFVLSYSTRNRPAGFERCLGCFASADLVVVGGSGSGGFLATVDSVTAARRRGRAFAGLPMDYLLERLGRPGAAQLKLTYEPPGSRATWVGEPLDLGRFRPQIGRRDLSVTATRIGQKLGLSLTYRPGRVSSDGAARLLEATVDQVVG
jgi:hypothetical protein